ncbi:MAG TPA: VCBS repeat-containing protein [Saprospiraceae bacterium]|nr:VCBS repeat-containing protein [Saprospiraceae bacterium]HMQ81887.1 VCBS repeat-containing protein [Saprospiraceae bacterium]
MNRKSAMRYGTILFFFLSAFWLIHCSPNEPRNAPTDMPEEEGLAKLHCKSCHIYPEPELLDRTTWMRVLTSMELEMKDSDYQIPTEDWYAIQRFYLNQSPNLLGEPAHKRLDKASQLFRSSDLLEKVPNAAPLVTLLQFDPASQTLFAGDYFGNLFEFDKNGLIGNYNIQNVPVCVNHKPQEGLLEILCIGSLMPSDEMTGQLIQLNREGEQQILVDSLIRPVHFLNLDLDNDGVQEYLIASFGSTREKVNTGKLSIFTAENGVYREKVIKQLPGALQSIAGDFNGDGLGDFMALFAQGREIISLFINKGGLEFEEKQLLEFSPLNGSNSFELVDMDGDSDLDIVMTNGDNGDNGLTYKYYHGVRIFTNNGRYEFKETYFFPVNGASKVIVRDFDGDGDPDMAVLAMFPNLFRWPQETLLVFNNKKRGRFEPTYLEKEPSARWMVMTAGDMDQDGDEELMVGANYKLNVLLPPAYKEKWQQNQLSYLLFSNLLSDQ